MLKPSGDVNGDEQRGVEQGFDGLGAQIGADLGADHLGTLNCGFGLGQIFRQGLAQIVAQGFSAFGFRHADKILVIRIGTDLLNDQARQVNPVQCVFHLLVGHRGVELDLDHGAAGKVYAVERAAFDEQGGHPGQNKEN